MFGVVGDLLHGFEVSRHVAAEIALGMDHRTCGTKLVPDRVRIFSPARIGVIEVVNPIRDRRMIGHEQFLSVSKSDDPANGPIPRSLRSQFQDNWTARARPCLPVRQAPCRRRLHAHCRTRRARTVQARAICSGRAPGICPDRRELAAFPTFGFLPRADFQIGALVFLFAAIIAGYVRFTSAQIASLPGESLAREIYCGAVLGSIGVVPRTPRISSKTLAPARSAASPRGAATICKPTGRPEAVNPHGRDSAGQHTSVMA